MTTVDDGPGLPDLDVAIGDAEARGDRPWFEALLAPASCMVRPDGLRFDDRAAFLAALQPGPRRRTRVESVVTYDNRAAALTGTPAARAGRKGTMNVTRRSATERTSLAHDHVRGRR